MKKKNVFSLLLCMLLLSMVVLSGCGDDEEETKSQASTQAGAETQQTTSGSNIGNSSENQNASGSNTTGSSENQNTPETVETTESAPAAVSTGFGKIGNDPNNIFQTPYCMAFDDEHVYFVIDGVVMQAKFDGSEAKYLCDAGSYLNVYDGSLYIAQESSKKYLIKRVDLSTYEVETIKKEESEVYFTAMLAADDYLFYSVISGGNQLRTSIAAIDLKTGSEKVLFEGAYDYANPKMTVSNGTLYVLNKVSSDNSMERAVYSVNIADISKGALLTDVGGTHDFGKYNTVIFEENSILTIGKQKKCYYRAPYSSIDPQNTVWPLCPDDGEIGAEIDTLPDDLYYLISEKTERFLLGDTMYVMGSTRDLDHEFYRIENFDFENAELVMTVPAPASDILKAAKAPLGKWKNAVYTIQENDSDAESKYSLIALNADGTHSTSEVILSENQPDTVDIYIGSQTIGDFRYDMSTQHAYVTGYLGSDKEVVIPDTVNGVPVTGISNYVFQKKSVTKVVIPDTVSFIGIYAFDHCSDLVEVNMPESLQSIGEYAFYGTGITTLTLPETFETFGYAAFGECHSLTDVTILGHPEKIEDYAFYLCDALQHITLPENLTELGMQAFYGCYQLQEITLPEGLQGIGDSCFYGCGNITSVIVPDSVTWVGTNVFASMGSLQSAVIGEGLSYLGGSMFSFDRELTEITIGSNVKDIWERVFEGTGFESIYIPDTVTFIEASCFANSSKIKTIRGKAGSEAQKFAEARYLQFEEADH